MAISKKDRETVYRKFGGRCAYCGCELTKGWHVDELEPVVRGWEYLKDEHGNRIWDTEKKDYKTKPTMLYPERLTLANQMPACAPCNIQKNSFPLEAFRQNIFNFVNSLNQYSTQYKFAKRYGLVQETVKPIVFYFETLTHKED